MSARRWPRVAVAALALAGCGRAVPPGGQAAPPAAGAPSGGAPDGGSPAALRFDDVTAASGVDAVHHPGYTAAKRMPEIMGSGVALVDVNRDGAPDVLAVDSGVVGGPRPASAANRLFLGDGKGGFTDATAAWRLPSEGYGMGVAAGDFDGDGWPDVALTAYGDGLRLLRNTGAAFEDVTAAAGLPADVGWGASAGWFDAERDGDLDLFVTRYLAYDPATARPCFDGGLQVYCTPLLYEGVTDLLFVNNGDGTFRDGTADAGLTGVAANGLALALFDVDQDGDVDAFVANDIDPNQLWLNDGGGRFVDAAVRAGVALSSDGRTQAGMGVDAADVDGDGLLDLAVAYFQLEPLSLLKQRDGLLFNDVSQSIGIGATARERLKWGTAFFDADNDGDDDLATAAGHIYDNAAELGGGLTFAQPSLLFENTGDGRFRDVSATAGAPFSQPAVSRGLATGDLDGDGGVDVVLSRNGGLLALGRNVTPARGHWLSLWLEGRAGHRSAIGARVTVTAGGRTVRRQVMGASSYLSVADRRIHAGLGAAERADAVDIVWPDGTAQSLGPLDGDAFYRVPQGGAPEAYTPGGAVLTP